MSNLAQQLVKQVIEADEEQPPSDKPAYVRRGSTPERRTALGNAKDSFAKLKVLMAKKRETEEALEWSISWEHLLSGYGLHPEDVEQTLRRRSHERWGAMGMKNRLKAKGDPRWQEATDIDIIGVTTKDGETIMFENEWMSPPPPGVGKKS